MTEPSNEAVMIELLSMISVRVDQIFYAVVVGVLVLLLMAFNKVATR